MGVPVVYNLRNLVERKGTTLMTAVGIGLTVAVLITALALTAGLKSVFAGTGDPRHVLVLRKGVDAELTSTVTNESYQIIRRLKGIATTPDGEPMVSPEALTIVNLPRGERTGEEMNVTVRGMLPIGVTMRTLTVERGEMFKPGLRQVVVGESIARRYPGARIGNRVKFGRGEWEVVGVFRAGESAANSEIWTDLNQLRGDFEQEGGSSSLLIRGDVSLENALAQTEVAETAAARVRAEQAAATEAALDAGKEAPKFPPVDDALPDGLAELRKAVAADQRLGSQVIGEKNYYAAMSSSGAPLQALGFSVAVIMAVGSAFAATNTMYAAVARRSREIGTLRALGFGRLAILRSFMLESICLALLGGALGVLLTLPINGLTTGVGNFSTFSETAFKFKISPDAVAWGLAFAAVIGAIGGFLPAWSASKKGIVAAMREA